MFWCWKVDEERVEHWHELETGTRAANRYQSRWEAQDEGFLILVHVLGFTLWLGGGIATMVAGVTAKGFAPPSG